MASKRRCKINLLSLSFVSKIISKSLVIKLLKRDNQLQLFRRLEQSSKKLINSQCAVEFLQLCQNFGLTPTFARVNKSSKKKWKSSSKNFEASVITEELMQKKQQIYDQKDEVNRIYAEIRSKCSTLRYVYILKTMVKINEDNYQRVMKVHTKKISRMLSCDTDVDEHINNISSYQLNFFQKLILCRGLKFAYPTHVSEKEIHASFEKAYRTLDQRFPEDKKDLTAATLRSIALNYAERRTPTAPKSLRRAIGQLRKRDDIVVTKPDKGTGVVVMDKSHYNTLLKEASVDNKEKFRSVIREQPKTRGKPTKHFHPLLQKEKQLERTVRNILPKDIADDICPKGSRLAHLYGLRKHTNPNWLCDRYYQQLRRIIINLQSG